MPVIATASRWRWSSSSASVKVSSTSASPEDLPKAVGGRTISAETLGEGINPQELLLDLARGIDEDRRDSSAVLEASFAQPPAEEEPLEGPASADAPDSEAMRGLRAGGAGRERADAGLRHRRDDPRPVPRPVGRGRARGRPSRPERSFAGCRRLRGRRRPLRRRMRWRLRRPRSARSCWSTTRRMSGASSAASSTWSATTSWRPWTRSRRRRRRRRLARTETPFLVVTDLGMPTSGGASYQGGFEVVKRLWKMNLRPPVLMMAESLDPSLRARARQMGVAGFVFKPGLAKLDSRQFEADLRAFASKLIQPTCCRVWPAAATRPRRPQAPGPRWRRRRCRPLRRRPLAGPRDDRAPPR